MLQRMEAQDEEFGSRLRALERLSGGEGRRREEDLHDQRRGRRGRRWGGGGDSAGAGRGVKVYGRCPRRPVSNPESRFDSESPKPPLNVNSSCAPSPPAGPAWLKPCRHFSTAPRRRHHRQPRDRPAGEYRAPPRRVTFIEGSITDLDLLKETFPGADGILAIPSVPRSVIDVNVGLLFPSFVGISFPTPLKSIVNFPSFIWKPHFSRFFKIRP